MKYKTQEIMFMLATILNSTGLIFDITGALIAYMNSPENLSNIDGGSFTDNQEELVKETAKRNKRMKCGFLLIAIGFLFQFTSNLCQR